MVQVISQPRESQGPPAEPGEPKRTLRFEWPGLGPEIVVYKPSHHRPGETAMQSLPTIWMTPARGAPWQYGGLADPGIAPAQESLASLGWHGARHLATCSGMLLLLLLLVRYVERYRPLLRFRARRPVKGHLQVTYQLRRSAHETDTGITVYQSEDLSDFKVPPPSFEFPDPSTDGTKPKQDQQDSKEQKDQQDSKEQKDQQDSTAPPPYYVKFTTGKNNVPQLRIFDTKLVNKPAFESPDPSTDDTKPKQDQQDSKEQKDQQDSTAPPPYYVNLTTGKNNVPQLRIFNTKFVNKQKLLEQLGASDNGMPNKNMKPAKIFINLPKKADMKNLSENGCKSKFVIKITDQAKASGCVVGLDLVVKDGVGLKENKEGPLDIKVEKPKSDDQVGPNTKEEKE